MITTYHCMSVRIILFPRYRCTLLCTDFARNSMLTLKFNNVSLLDVDFEFVAVLPLEVNRETEFELRGTQVRNYVVCFCQSGEV